MIYTDYLAKMITLDFTSKILEVKDSTVLVETRKGVKAIDALEFKKKFIAIRKQRSKNLKPQQINDSTYIVVNNSKGTQYNLTLLDTRIDCDCIDYQNQVEYFGGGCCKHGYSVLNELGFNSLKDYVECQRLEKLYLEYLESEDFKHLAYSKY